MEDFKFSEFSSFSDNGKVEDINKLEEHLTKMDKAGISYKQKLKIGDRVKLKGLDYIVIVQHVDYEIPEIGVVDYAGKKIGEEEYLCLFNQKDIESVLDGEKDLEEEER